MNLKILQALIFSCALNLILWSCDKTMPVAPEENMLLDGPIEGLSIEQQRQFLMGDEAFNNDIFTVEKGLGPIFNANSCGSRHAGDGKGHPFIRFTRFGQVDSIGNQFLHVGEPFNCKTKPYQVLGQKNFL